MKTVNIHEAKIHLSRILEEAALGETIIIAKAGKPMAKLMALDAPQAGQKQRLGFLQGQIKVPEDFDQIGEEVIEQLFGGGT